MILHIGHILTCLSNTKLSKTKIGIIGSGIAGMAAAYYLSKSEEYEITLFEKLKRHGGKIGGVDIDGTYLDLGGKYLLSTNELTLCLCDDFDIPVKKYSKERIILNSDTSIFVPSSSSSFYRQMRGYVGLITKYKVSLLRLFLKSKSYKKKLQHFYDLLENSSNLPEDILSDFEDFLNTDSKSHLLKIGISNKLVDEFFNPFQRGIYMQNLDELVAIFVIFLLGAFDEDLLVIPGGNNVLIDKLSNYLTEKFEVITGEEVQSITRQGNKYKLVTTKDHEDFDYVFIATSYHDASNIKYEGFGTDFDNYINLMRSVKYNDFTFKHVIKGDLQDLYRYSIEPDRYLHLNQGDGVYLLEKHEIGPSSRLSDVYVLSSITKNIDISKYFTSHEYVTDILQWKQAYPQFSAKVWKTIDELKQFELNHHDQYFTHLMISSNNYLTSIETSVMRAKSFYKMVIRNRQ